MCFDRGMVQINEEEERDYDRLGRTIGLMKGGCPLLQSEVSVGAMPGSHSGEAAPRPGMASEASC